jgi:CRP/FNR family transcriptional regulator, cyclic AMP receptor protein
MPADSRSTPDNSISRDPWFRALDPARQQSLLARATIRSIGTGVRLYSFGDPPNGLHAVVRGEVRLFAYPEPGAETVVNIIRSGQWFGELSVIDGLGRPHDAIASEPSRILSVPMLAMVDLIERFPLLWRDLALLGCAHQRLGIRALGRLRSKTAIKRLSGFLANWAVAEDSRDVSMSQSELSQIIGVSRQRINVLASQLQADGLIVLHYGKIEICDPDRLRSLARL